MPEWLEKMRDDFARLWGNLSAGQRWLVGGLSAGLLVVLVGFALFLSVVPGGELLYAGLSEGQLARVTRFLEEQGVTYSIENGNVYVSQDREKLRAEFSYANRHSKALGGYKVLLGHNWSQTKDQFDETRLRALQEELEISIEQGSENIDWARVQLTPGNKALFQRDKTKPTAAVKVGTLGMGMSADQVEGLQWFVASSLEGLEPADVVVMDENNRMLKGHVAKTDRERLTSEQRSREVERQNEIISAVAAILDPPLGGSSNYTIAAMVELDYDKKEIVETLIDASETFERRLQTEETDETDVQTGGVPGTPPNTPGDTLGEGSSSQVTSSRTMEKREVESEPRSRREMHTEIAPGEVERQSVSVLINYPTADSEEEDRQPWPEDFMADLEDALETAVGHIDSSTRFAFVLKQMPFDTSAARTAEMQARWATIRKNVESGFFLLLALVSTLAFFLFLRKVFSMQAQGEQLEEIEAELPLDAEELAVRELGDEGSMGPEDRKAKRIREQIETYAQDNPESAANILRQWLTE